MFRVPSVLVETNLLSEGAMARQVMYLGALRAYSRMSWVCLRRSSTVLSLGSIFDPYGSMVVIRGPPLSTLVHHKCV